MPDAVGSAVVRCDRRLSAPLVFGNRDNARGAPSPLLLPDPPDDLGLHVWTPYDVGLLILRLVLGVTLAAHGYNKFFGGGRIPGTARWFESIGMKPGKFHATVAATTELAAGLGLAAGLLTPIPAAGFVALMLVAAWTVHRANGFFIVKEGWEYNLVLAVSAIAVAALGPGRLSLD